jgi:hypothetical protein
MDNQNIIAINRTMQAGAGMTTKFNEELFEKTTLPPVRDLLELGLSVIIASCGDTSSRFGEAIDDDGLTPTVRAFQKALPKEIASGKLILLVVKNWGLNAGSTAALNQSIALARKRGFEYCIPFSTEIAVREDLILEAIQLMDIKFISYDVIGFLRQRWQEKRQWKVPQNTCSMWRLSSLCAIDDFDENCDGTGKTIFVPDRGEVLLAGMDAFHAMLRMMRNRALNWTMVGQRNPVSWVSDFKKGSQREQDFLNKIARQELVMVEWAREIFPDEDPQRVIEALFDHYT